MAREEKHDFVETDASVRPSSIDYRSVKAEWGLFRLYRAFLHAP